MAGSAQTPRQPPIIAVESAQKCANDSGTERMNDFAIFSDGAKGELNIDIERTDCLFLFSLVTAQLCHGAIRFKRAARIVRLLQNIFIQHKASNPRRRVYFRDPEVSVRAKKEIGSIARRDAKKAF